MQTQDNPLDREEVIPFKAEHISLMKIADETKLIYKIPHLLPVYEQIGTSYTFVQDGEYLCAGGVIPIWEGMGEAWFVLADNMEIAQYSICATVKRYYDNLADSSYGRIQASVSCEDEKGIRFIEWLGFKKEGRMSKFDIDGKDHYLYART